MQLILRPVSDARLKEIIVTESRFAIGRNEAHFDAYDRSVTAKLSRRHAEIFERDGRIYASDLKSGNGTTINGQPVGNEPVGLNVDDEIAFGGLRYRVEHIGGPKGAATVQSAVDAKVILAPTVTDGSMDTIVISQFPFLVSRYSDIFSRYQKSFPKPFALLSRSHAKIFLRSEAVYIQDLESTNGTYIDGERLTLEPRKLETKDTVTFGDEPFTYRVQTFVGALTVIEANAEVAKLSAGTIFVSDGSNFFDVYMAASKKDAEASGAAGDSDADRNPGPDAKSRTRPASKLRRVFTDVRDSLRAGGPADRGLRFTVIASLASLAAAVAGYVYLSWPAWRVERLIDDGEYLSAAKLADRYLGRLPQSDRLRNLATEASVQAFVPEWQAAIEAGNYLAAERVLDLARRTGANNSRDDEIFDALELAAEITEVELSADGRSLLLSALSGDASINVLSEEWDSRQSQYRRALLEVERNVDGFDVYQTEFYRSLRELRERSAHLEPLLELRNDVVAALARRDTTRLRDVLAAFSAEQPTVDLAPLAEDVARHETVEQDIAERQWLRAYDRENQANFNTAPFAEHQVFMNEAVLPDASTREAYARAAQLWAGGATRESFNLLEELSGRPWGEDAQRNLERNRALLADFDELRADPSAADFEEELFALFARLDSESDAYLHADLAPEFQRHRDAALARAAERTREAQLAWEKYETLGRLQGVHRLQDQVTPDYRNLASLLTTAYQNLREGESIHQQLDAPIPEAWADLNRQVVQEIKLQTGIVRNLLVIDSEVRQAKVGLLPELPSD